MLRSIRYEADRRPPLLSDAGADRGDREGVAATEVAVRGEARAVLPAEPRPLRGPRRSVHGDRRIDGGGTRAAALDGAALGAAGRAVRRDAAAARLWGQNRAPTTCSAATSVCSTPIPRRERAGAALAFRFKLALAAGFSCRSRAARAAARRSTWRRSRGRPAAWSARAARRRLPAQRGDAPVHGRGAGAASRVRPSRSGPLPPRPIGRSPRPSSTMRTSGCGPRRSARLPRYSCARTRRRRGSGARRDPPISNRPSRARGPRSGDSNRSRLSSAISTLRPVGSLHDPQLDRPGRWAGDPHEVAEEAARNQRALAAVAGAERLANDLFGLDRSGIGSTPASS